MQKYKLRYLPLFYQDAEEIVSYITNILENPQAALNLIDEVEKAILERSENAEAFAKYNSSKERKYPYYRIKVKSVSAPCCWKTSFHTLNYSFSP